MSFRLGIAEEDRIRFIDDCIKFDTPRLESEKYPEEVAILKEKRYDIYTPVVDDDLTEAFFLIHGGAFVYGHRALDKAFGMELAKKSGLPVINVDYKLMPDANLSEIMSELVDITNEISSEYRIKKFHMVGDSAGAYLALMMSLVNMSKEMCKELELTVEPCCSQVLSAGLICGVYSVAEYAFPGIYFESKSKYAYDLLSAVEKYGAPPCAVITGEEDFLREDNQLINRLLINKGIPCYFMDAKSKPDEGRNMFHVFPIANPLWPEGQQAIDLIIKAAGL